MIHCSINGYDSFSVFRRCDIILCSDFSFFKSELQREKYWWQNVELEEAKKLESLTISHVFCEFFFRELILCRIESVCECKLRYFGIWSNECSMDIFRIFVLVVQSMKNRILSCALCNFWIRIAIGSCLSTNGVFFSLDVSTAQTFQNSKNKKKKKSKTNEESSLTIYWRRIFNPIDSIDRRRHPHKHGHKNIFLSYPLF